MTASSHILSGALPAPENADAVLWDSLQAAASAGGNTEAFRKLVERHGGALHRFCLHSLGCERDAEDV